MPVTWVQSCSDQQPCNVSAALEACPMHGRVAIFLANAEVDTRAVLI
jgi:hypothetical protein